MRTIAKPFGLLMMWLYETFQNYGVAIILFATIVRLIMLPFQMKSKRGMMRMQLLNPQLQDIQKRYAGNQQKINEETQKLYQEAGVNPMSGCLWSLLPFPILIALYYAIREPITTMMGVAAEKIAEGGSIYQKLIDLGYEVSARSAYGQISMSKFISEHFEAFQGLDEKLRQINYNFLGLDLGSTPDYRIWSFNWSDTKALLPALGLFMIPVLTTALQYLQSWITQKLSPPADPQASAQTSSMMLMMPLMTLWFTFIMPAAMGLYWAMGSVLSIIQEVVLTKYYQKALASETAELDERRRQKEAEWEKKRLETERLKALNATTENENTSKEKKRQREKAERERAERDWADAKSGEEREDEPSRVGHRKYARGRAYDPDRYTRREDSPAPDETGAQEDKQE